MIFVTVGTELPFNRMVRIVDQWAARARRPDVFAQIGKTDWAPTTLEFRQFLDPTEFASKFSQASIVIAHAGMGTILSALQAEKPILVVPRLASLGEHRNEHQLATARRMRDMEGIEVAFDEVQLLERLDRIDELAAGKAISRFASRALTDAIHAFILHGHGAMNENKHG